MQLKTLSPRLWLRCIITTGMENIIYVVILIIVILYWWDNRKGGEQVLYYCRRQCEKAGVQLLDASVVRQRSWLRKKPGGGLQICRLYSFEYSDDEKNRRYGYIVLIGQQVVESGFPAI